eukprot:scaffold180274_cov31-Prasinocladus_malaysianus.AAC.1
MQLAAVNGHVDVVRALLEVKGDDLDLDMFLDSDNEDECDEEMNRQACGSGAGVPMLDSETTAGQKVIFKQRWTQIKSSMRVKKMLAKSPSML